MNLIDQLGGYEKSKRELKFKEESSILQCCSSITADMIRDALLDYRRANNIFEMDDYIIHDGELKVFAIWSTAIEGCAYIGYAFAEDGEMADKSKFRHATDAEIAAGHRLPTCEVLDEADIPTTAIILEQKDGKQK